MQLRYIKLLCTYEPQNVCAFLASHTAYPLEETLQVRPHCPLCCCGVRVAVVSVLLWCPCCCGVRVAVVSVLLWCPCGCGCGVRVAVAVVSVLLWLWCSCCRVGGVRLDGVRGRMLPFCADSWVRVRTFSRAIATAWVCVFVCDVRWWAPSTASWTLTRTCWSAFTTSRAP
jgi:hypothetical protein